MFGKTVLWACTLTLLALGLAVAFSVVEIRSTIRIPGNVQTSIRFVDAAAVSFDENFSTEVALDGRLAIPIEAPFKIPLDFELTFPVDASLRIDQDFMVAADVPVKFTLTPDAKELRDVWVNLDTQVFVDDTLEVDLQVPVTGPVQAFGMLDVPVAGVVPVKAVIPIRQPIRIKDRIKVGLSNLDLDVDVNVPVKLNVPIHQDVRVRGNVVGRVRKTIVVPISEHLDVPLRAKMPVGLHFDAPIKVDIKEFVPIAIRFDEALPISLGGVTLGASSAAAASPAGRR